MKGCCSGCVTALVLLVGFSLLVGGWDNSTWPERVLALVLGIGLFSLVAWLRKRYPKETR
jgi:hypothetical protein